MTFNTREIVHQVQNEFDDLLDYVTRDAQNRQVNEVERGIWRRLLHIGYLLLQTYFQMRCAQYGQEPLVSDAGEKTPFLQEKERSFYSIFGKMKLSRPYFYRKGGKGYSPLDELLGMGGDIYSDMLREMHEELSVYVAYGKATKFINRFLGIKLSGRVLQQLVNTDAVDVVTYYDKKEPPAIESEGEILVVQADGKGVPMLITEMNGKKQTRKKEAIVTTVYTIDTNPRTVDDVIATFFDKTETGDMQQRNRPQNKQVWATLKGKDEALQRLQRQVVAREDDLFEQRVALCDGDEALQARIQAYFPRFTLILDFIHAYEYLWNAANTLFAEDDSEKDKWMRTRTRQLLASQTTLLIDDLRHLGQHSDTTPQQQVALHKAANYFTRNTPYMDYQACLQRGWPIASGVIEGACRHLVKDRMELSGMRWVQSSAEALLRLRAVAENEDWDEYHAFRRRCQQRRLYHPEKCGKLFCDSAEFEPTIYHQLPLAF